MFSRENHRLCPPLLPRRAQFWSPRLLASSKGRSWSTWSFNLHLMNSLRRFGTFLMAFDSGPRGDLVQAEQSMRLAVESNPGSRIAHAGLGIVLLERYALTGEQELVDEGVAELTVADRIGAREGLVFFQYEVGRAAA